MCIVELWNGCRYTEDGRKAKQDGMLFDRDHLITRNRASPAGLSAICHDKRVWNMWDFERKRASRWIHAACGTLLLCSVFSVGVRTALAYPVALSEPEGFYEVSGIDNAWDLAPPGA